MKLFYIMFNRVDSNRTKKFFLLKNEMSQKRSLEIEDNDTHCKNFKLDSKKIKEKILKHNPSLHLKQHKVQKFLLIFL